MRRISSILVTLMGIFLLLGAGPPCPESYQHAEGIEFIPCPKTYIASDQVVFVDNQMMIQFTDDIAFLTDAIYQDANGIFITSRSKQNRPCYFWEWICPCCETCNNMMRQTCKYCGHGRDDSPFDCDE